MLEVSDFVGEKMKFIGDVRQLADAQCEYTRAGNHLTTLPQSVLGAAGDCIQLEKRYHSVRASSP